MASAWAGVVVQCIMNEKVTALAEIPRSWSGSGSLREADLLGPHDASRDAEAGWKRDCLAWASPSRLACVARGLLRARPRPRERQCGDFNPYGGEGPGAGFCRTEMVLWGRLNECQRLLQRVKAGDAVEIMQLGFCIQSLKNFERRTGMRPERGVRILHALGYHEDDDMRPYPVHVQGWANVADLLHDLHVHWERVRWAAMATTGLEKRIARIRRILRWYHCHRRVRVPRRLLLQVRALCGEVGLPPRPGGEMAGEV